MKVQARIEYTKQRRIGVGQGQNSEVYLVKDPQLGGIVIAKEIPLAKLGNDQNRYFEEARAMFKSEHRNVVPINYACATSTHVCLVMPYYKQGSLSDQINKAPITLSETLSMGFGMLSGVTAIHNAGFLHLDIKPSNVLFSDSGHAMLADFGQSRRLRQNGTVAQPKMYIWAIPPEVLDNNAAIIASDIFQAGLTLYRAVNGDNFYMSERPHRSDLADQIINGKFPHRDRFMPHVPRRLRTVIRKSLRLDPADRYQSAVEFSAALTSVAIDLDWQTEAMPDGGLRWTANRPCQPAYRVELRPDDAKWRVQVHTIAESKTPRAKGKRDLWNNQLTRTQALKHLKAVFESLSS